MIRAGCLKGRAADHGFTLVELMVVILIIGIALGAVSLAITSRDPIQELQQSADQFAYQMERIQDQVLLNKRERGLMFVQDGVYLLEWREGDIDTGEPEIVWSLIGEGRSWGISNSVQLDLTLENQWIELNLELPDEESALEPHVILLPSEDHTPAFDLVLRLTDSMNDEVRIRGDGFNKPMVIRDAR